MTTCALCGAEIEQNGRRIRAYCSREHKIRMANIRRTAMLRGISVEDAAERILSRAADAADAGTPDTFATTADFYAPPRVRMASPVRTCPACSRKIADGSTYCRCGARIGE